MVCSSLWVQNKVTSSKDKYQHCPWKSTGNGKQEQMERNKKNSVESWKIDFSYNNDIFCFSPSSLIGQHNYIKYKNFSLIDFGPFQSQRGLKEEEKIEQFLISIISGNEKMTFFHFYRYYMILDVAVVWPPHFPFREVAFRQQIGLKPSIFLETCLAEISNKQPGVLFKLFLLVVLLCRLHLRIYNGLMEVNVMK